MLLKREAWVACVNERLEILSPRFMQGCMKLRLIKLLQGRFLIIINFSCLFLLVKVSSIKTSDIFPLL